MAAIGDRLRRRIEENLWYDGGYRHMTLANPDGPDEQQATIDALVAALEAVQKGVPDVLRRECLNQVVEDALALARGEG